MTRFWLLAPIVLTTIGCAEKNPLEGKSEKELQAMQKAEQQKADEEEMQYNSDRKKSQSGKR